jgi:hypothetical protein
MKKSSNKKTVKNNAQAKHNKRKKQKSSVVKTNTTSIQSFTHLKYFLLRLGMFGRVIILLFNPIWQTLKDSVSAFKDACDKLKLLVDGLNLKYNAYKQITKNVANDKKLAKQALAEAGYRIMNSCRSYAVKNGLTSLAMKMDVNLSDLLGMKYKNLLSLMINSSELIQPLIPLPDFNITQDIYDDLQTKILDAQSLENGPKSAIEQRKSIGSELLIDMKTTMEFFDNELVPLASNFRSNNTFWFAFVTAKRIGKASNHHGRLLAHCESELGNPFFGLTVTVDEYSDPATGKTYKAVSATTDPNGDADVIEFFAGYRTVTVSGKDIETTTYPAISFPRGKAISHLFIVKPAYTNMPAPQETKQKVKN